MQVKRETSNFIKYFIDNFFPPILRDKKLFLLLPFKFQFGSNDRLYFSFRENAYLMSEDQYQDSYLKASKTLIHGGTDLNSKCLKRILKDIKGNTVLVVACGRGDLSLILSKKYKLTACDIVEHKNLSNIKELSFIKANVEKLPFKNRSFDTVISTHTLEHSRDIYQAIKELKRVCKKRLIIVLPKERPYRFGFNFHLNFFPYKFSLYPYFSQDVAHLKICELDGDWYLVRDF